MAKRSSNPINAKINKNFLIRTQLATDKTTNLVSAGKYHKTVGVKLKNKHFKTVLNNGAQNTTFKIRNRLKIVFHSK